MPPGAPIVPLGKLVAGHGVRGRARVRPFHREGTTLLECGAVWLDPPGEGTARRFRIVGRQRHRDQILIELEGIDSLTALEPWLGSQVGIEEALLPPAAENEFYQYKAVGLTVSTVDGRLLGEVAEVLTTAGNDVWIVRAAETAAEGTSPQEFLIPVVGEIVEEIDLTARTARIRPIPGLLDD